MMKKIIFAVTAACLLAGISVAQVSHGGKGPTMVGPSVHSMPQIPRNAGSGRQTPSSPAQIVKPTAVPGNGATRVTPNVKTSRPTVHIGSDAATFEPNSKLAAQN